MKKPALRLFLSFGAGILLGAILNANLSVAIQLGAASFILCLLLTNLLGVRPIAWLGWLLSFGLGVLWLSLAQNDFQSQTVVRYAGKKQVWLSGDVTTPPEIQGNRLKWTIRAHRLIKNDSVFSVSGNVLASSKILDLPLKIGDRVGLIGQLRLPRPRRNPGEFDYRAYLKRRKISVLFYLSERQPLYIRHTRRFLPLGSRLVAPLRRHFLLVIQQYLGYGPEAHLLKGLLLGQRGEIEPSVRTAFARTGVIHVLAVSGLHVGFVLALLLFLLRFFRPPGWLQLTIVLIALLFYSNLTGNKPPVVRASVMAFLVLLGYQLQRPLDVVNILAFAALLLLVANPFALFDASFQLSFLAVLGILLLYTRIWHFLTFSPKNTLQKFLHKYVLPLLSVSLAAQLATLPLIFTYYHRIPLYALAANLVVIPLVFLIVSGGFLLFALAPLFPILAKELAAALLLSLKFLIQFVTFFSRLPGGNVQLSGKITVWNAAFFVLLLGFFWFAAEPRRLRQVILALTALLVTWFGWNTFLHSRPALTVHFLDAGRASAAVVELPDHTCLIVNAGTTSRLSRETERILVPFLKYAGFRRVEALFLAAFRPDFAGGRATLRHLFPVKTVLCPASPADFPPTQGYSSHTPSGHCTFLSGGDYFLPWHGTGFWIFGPDSGHFSPQRDALVAKLTFGQRSVLFAEGAPLGEQRALANRFGSLLKSDVLALSRNPFPEFLRAVSPQWIILRQKSPAFPTVAGLFSGRILSIPQTGEIEIRTNGHRLWLRTPLAKKQEPKNR